MLEFISLLISHLDFKILDIIITKSPNHKEIPSYRVMMVLPTRTSTPLLSTLFLPREETLRVIGKENSRENKVDLRPKTF